MNIKHHESSGFTLIEAMITMLIVSIGLLAMAQLLITSIQQNNRSEMRIDASSAVQTLLKEATVSIKKDTDCVDPMTLATPTRTYLAKGYTEEVRCFEILGPSGEQQERYLIKAKVFDPTGRELAAASSIMTTVVSEL